MKTQRKQLNVELYNIFCEVFAEESDRQQAIRESITAFTVIKQDALFRAMPIMSDEQ